jgi:hypothetical protein
MSDLAFPSDGRSKLNLAPIIRERWASGTPSLSAPSDSCSCGISSSPTSGMSSTYPPYTIPTSSLSTSPSFTSSSFSLLSTTNSFTKTPLDSRSSSTPTHLSSTSSPIPASRRLSLAGNTVCLGHGLDASVDGLLVTIVLFGLIGLLLWVSCTLSFAFFPQHLLPLSYYLPLFGRIAAKYTGSENGSCRNGAYIPCTRIPCAHSV